MGIFEMAALQPGRKRDGLGRLVERRGDTRLPTLRSSQSGMSAHLWELELVPAIALARLNHDIGALSERALDQNIFFEPTVLRAAWPRLTSLLAPHGVWMACLWQSGEDNRALRLFMPIRIHKVGLPRKTVLQPLSNQFMPIGTPLIDAEYAGEACETLLRLLSDPDLNLPDILDLAFQRTDSASTRALIAAANSLGLSNSTYNSHQRAALLSKNNGEGKNATGLSKKHLRELARQFRKLEEKGETRFEIARSQNRVLDSVEEFLTLELSGWKGRKGTALYNHKRIAAFSRQIVAELAMNKNCEIVSLKHSGKTIAALILLGREGRFVAWKIAFDETMSAYSPGMQVMVKATQDLLKRKQFLEADSLAVPNHQMMNRVWPERLAMTDMAIALTPEADQNIDQLIAAKSRLQDWKLLTKNALRRTRMFHRILGR